MINRVATKTLDNKTPYEALRSKTPNVAHLRVFGCVCYAKTNAVGRRKLDDRSKVLVHLGTEPGSKAYRLLDPTKKKIVVSRDVVFDERRGWNWTNDESVEDNDDGGSFTVEFKKIDGVTQIEDETQTDVQTGDINEEDDDNESSDDQGEQPQLRRSSRTSTMHGYLDDYVLIAEAECERLLTIVNDEPWDYAEAKELNVWIDACQDEFSVLRKITHGSLLIFLWESNILV